MVRSMDVISRGRYSTHRSAASACHCALVENPGLRAIAVSEAGGEPVVIRVASVVDAGHFQPCIGWWGRACHWLIALRRRAGSRVGRR